MKVEILYFEGCPNYLPAVTRVREVLEQEGVSAEMVEVQVRDLVGARRVSFLGSPSVRINGLDIEPSARSSQAIGLMCRTYCDRGGSAGIPPLEWIKVAVREAKENSHTT